jgi:hypothetical protein
MCNFRVSCFAGGASDEIAFAKRQRDSAQRELESWRSWLARAMEEGDAVKVAELHTVVVACENQMDIDGRKHEEADTDTGWGAKDIDTLAETSRETESGKRGTRG